ncbi:MAG: Uncharacterised protein [Halieaceae bacterium]|nr:MAG: Uncharacterised protein [Halieaceae bacterium]
MLKYLGTNEAVDRLISERQGYAVCLNKMNGPLWVVRRHIGNARLRGFKVCMRQIEAQNGNIRTEVSRQRMATFATP